MRHGQVIVRDPGLAAGGGVLHRDANHQACAAGMTTCTTAPSLWALTVTKPDLREATATPTGKVRKGHNQVWMQRAKTPLVEALFVILNKENQLFKNFKNLFFTRSTSTEELY